MLEDGFREDERLIARERIDEDQDELSLRPSRWEEFFGQQKVKDNLRVFIQAAAQRNESLDHILLYGPPGLGKTTLAGIIANELGVGFRLTTGPAIEKAGDLAAILTNLNERDVLFIDEIHRLNKSVEEVLYPAMEDYALDIMIGKGPSARSIRLDLPQFTLIGATTRAGLLSAPLRDRFGVVNRLDLYDPADLTDILYRDAAILGVGIDSEALRIIAERSRGTPRIAIRLLRRLRDFAQVRGNGSVDASVARYGLEALEVDQRGLDATDRRIMKSIALMFHGGPVGLDTLSASTGEDPVTIEDVYEPFLMQIGFIAKTPRGRMLMPAAWIHLGLPVPENGRSYPPEQLALDFLERENEQAKDN